ncbi:MAG: hypothetical protein OQK73_10170 [Gammaproteobacteria bacterium]|nr:hypothetical protein [Gammaproteobacteria bacterium]
MSHQRWYKKNKKKGEWEHATITQGNYFATQASGIDMFYGEVFYGMPTYKLMQIQIIEDLYPYIDD